MEKWVVQTKRADFNKISNQYGIDPVIARIIRNRDVIEENEIEQYLHPSLTHLGNPALLKDVQVAVDLLADAIIDHKKIRVIGDYDIDGISSTYILKKAIERCGGIVDYAIPHRIEDGYGVNPHMIQQAAEDGIQLIITCDNGIAAAEAIADAKAKGMVTIITDHHEIPFIETTQGREDQLPIADAIVNPKQKDCKYPQKGICGAVVAWKLVFMLYAKCQIPTEEAYEFLENAAMATIGDVMELQGENRVIVTYGLQKLRQTKNPGLQALMKQAQIEPQQLSAYHIGFVLGPCFNASGRIDTAAHVMELLEASTQQEAIALAGELYRLNEERKEMTLQGVEDAMQAIREDGLQEDKVLVIYLPNLHESLAGIVAGRVKEEYYRPTIVITDGEKSAKGSGRSIESYSMYEELHKCQELFLQYGGHPMAAGLSLDKENIPILRERLNTQTSLSKDDLCKKIKIDVPMPLDYIREDLIEELQVLEPFGNGNPKPVFADRNISIKRIQWIGKNRNYLKMHLQSEHGRQLDALYFGDGQAFMEEMQKKYSCESWEAATNGRDNDMHISITYYPQINVYMERTSIQVIITNYC